ncbi:MULTISPECIES: branched-chain amino acid ABC transporter permease [Herbaspirillum]|jgi:branched-chain amino acid transport system permease protein|uniref:Branched-chain amino acid ABC transporter permease n=2 Tax=Herbaspirillum huttiense TaxID=863372 RepID=A0AAJ2HBK8_9BURK|nr:MULTISPECIES: branched-chain amino acid ABC transporter permease [Herbaspirillum]MBW9336258.1 branched-chain amino acid ABC transporter permease [Herbaspirillum sp. RU 5E]MDR9838259.1 branched-chain amino acid ABC transporter permease [Herbaspirillum huttiense]MRT28274.1 branched-chain amino acid ABC transporter permease [Herbaspirillum sp. CAH-3]UWE15319.1 branched-chain amino acid ABC transporter permease [Herbaspirillum huttiense]
MQRLFVPLLLVLAVLLPLLAQASGMEYYIGVVTRILIFAMVAASLNFILGYGGMVSFGHAVFFGLGAYVTAIASFHGVTSAWLIWLLAALVTALVGLVIGVIALRTRAVYFIMITMALAQLFYYFFVGFRYYGGDDGLQVTARPLLGFGLDMSGDNAFYWVVLAWLVASFVLLQRLLASRFGLALNAIRQNERRAQAIGYPALRYKLAAFVIAAVIAGLAGSLIGMSNLFASPKLLHWSQSGILLVMVALGGVGYFYGGLLGAAAFLLLEEVLSTHFEYWQIYVGLILLLVVMVAPRGVSSLATIGKTLKQGEQHGA